MSLVNIYRVWRGISVEEEGKIKELGLKIDLHPYESEEQKRERADLFKKAEEMGETLPKYNPVSVTRHECLDLLGPATDVRIGRPGSSGPRGIKWMPIPATEENREIVRKIEYILFQK